MYKIIVSIGLLYIKIVFDITPINAHTHITDKISIPIFFGSENMHSGVYVAAIKIYMPMWSNLRNNLLTLPSGKK